MNLPNDFLNRMKDYLKEKYDDFLASYDNPEVKGIRFNKTGNYPLSCFSLINSNKKDENNVINVPWEERGFIYSQDEDGISPGKHPLHEAGAYYIQEPSAMAPVHYLSVNKGDRVLDLCASPGGKSTQIASYLEGEGILISNEINGKRAQILSENIERMGVSNALVISEDPRDISGKFSGFFDKILVDAPCSGEGMFRRSETARDEWSLENVDMCANRQAWILDEAAKMLAPGGTLVYSTCTFAKEEDEENIKSFLERNSSFELADMEVFEGMIRGFGGIGIRLYPHRVSGEGHFLCKLVKRKVEDDLGSIDLMDAGTVHIKYPPVYGYESGLLKKEKDNLKEAFKLLKGILTEEAYARYVENRTLKMFGDNLYALPNECPSIKGIKVVRAGLQLGVLLKNRFEPSHSLVKAVNTSDFKYGIVLQCYGASSEMDDVNDNSVIYKYIRGETFNIADLCDSERCLFINSEEGITKKTDINGFVPIFIDDYPIGFGKITNGIVKNHYPKGLRKTL